jgi:serine/threonine protein kinase
MKQHGFERWATPLDLSPDGDAEAEKPTLVQSPAHLLENERAPRTLPRVRPGDSLFELERELAHAAAIAEEVDAAQAAAAEAARDDDAWSLAPSSDEPSHVGQLIDNRYVVEALIARGGMGIVYRCRHQLIERKFAVKIIRGAMAHLPDATRRFLLEAKAASAIGNEHIIDVVDYGMLADSSSYLVMELLEGLPLSELIARKEALPIARIATITAQVCEGLRAAHEAGIVHRDLKPENIFLSRRQGGEFVKILDFGIAKMMSCVEPLTKKGLIVGTPHYMSPEQAAGATVDPRGDIYSLGVILYELATGRVPFDATHYMAVLAKHMTEPPPPFASLSLPAPLPSAFEAIVQKCLAKRPEERFQSMLEVMEAIERLSRQPLALAPALLPAVIPPAPPSAGAGEAAPLSGSSVPAAAGRSVSVPARTRGASLVLAAVGMLALTGISLLRMRGPEELHGAGAPTALAAPELPMPAEPAQAPEPANASEPTGTPTPSSAHAPTTAPVGGAASGSTTPGSSAGAAQALVPAAPFSSGGAAAEPALIQGPPGNVTQAATSAEPLTAVELTPGKSVEIEARTRLSLRLIPGVSAEVVVPARAAKRRPYPKSGKARAGAAAKPERAPDAPPPTELMNPWPTPAIGPAKD